MMYVRPSKQKSNEKKMLDSESIISGIQTNIA